MLIDIETHLLPSGIVYRAIAVSHSRLLTACGNQRTPHRLDRHNASLGAVIMWFRDEDTLEVLSRGDLGGGDVRLVLLLGLYTGLAFT
jgi:hypothetical protein